MGVIGFPTLVLAGFVIKSLFGECISKISRKDAITKTIKYCSSLFTIHFEKVISQWVASNHCFVPSLVNGPILYPRRKVQKKCCTKMI